MSESVIPTQMTFRDEENKIEGEIVPHFEVSVLIRKDFIKYGSDQKEEGNSVKKKEKEQKEPLLAWF